MTFKDIALKNFKINIKRYLVYFLCNSFIVSTYFIYSVLIFNENLWSTSQVEKGVLEVLVIPSGALAIFSLVFISYSHSAFIKWRKKEFGLFMNLGMTINDIRKIIIYESVLVGFGSIILGVLTGIVFSRLFFIVITNLVGVTGIDYIVGYENFIFAIVIFSGIYLVNIITTIIMTCNFEIIKLLKADRMIQNNKFSNPTLAITGLLIVIGSYIALYIDFMSISGNRTTPIATLCILIGTYIFISQLGGFLINKFKKRNKIYYENLVLISSLNSKFKQIKKIIFMTSILVAVVIFYVGTMLSFYVTSETTAINNNVYDLSYAEIRDKNIIDEDRLSNIISNNNEEVITHKEAEFIMCYGSSEFPYEYVIMADKEVNKLSNINIDVEKGNYIDISQWDNISGDENSEAYNLRFNSNDGLYELYNQDSIYENIFRSSNYHYNNIIVVNEDDYNFIKSQNKYCEIGKFQLYNFNNWKDTKGIVDELTAELAISNKNTEAFNAKLLQDIESEYLKVSSKIGEYNYNKQSGMLILITSSYLGIFFFIAIGIVLFLKLLSDVDTDKRKFNSMIKIGITEEEIKREIGIELKYLFFIGPIIGIILAFGYVIVFNQDVAANIKSSFMYSNIIISVVFLLLQGIYYFICRNIYCNKILDN